MDPVDVEGAEEEEEEEGNAPLNLIEYVMRDPLLFGDFRNATNESEPRFYEDLLDFDAIFHLFTEVIILLINSKTICMRYKLLAGMVTDL